MNKKLSLKDGYLEWGKCICPTLEKRSVEKTLYRIHCVWIVKCVSPLIPSRARAGGVQILGRKGNSCMPVRPADTNATPNWGSERRFFLHFRKFGFDFSNSLDCSSSSFVTTELLCVMENYNRIEINICNICNSYMLWSFDFYNSHLINCWLQILTV